MYYFTLLLLPIFILSSCSSDDDNYYVEEEGTLYYDGRSFSLNSARIIEAGYDNFGLYNVVQLSSGYLSLNGISRADSYINLKIYNDIHTSFSGGYRFDDPLHRIVDFDYYENVQTTNGYVDSYSFRLGYNDVDHNGNIFLNNFSAGYIDTEFYFRDRNGKELRGYYTGRFEKAYY